MHGNRLINELSEQGRTIFTTAEAKEISVGLGIPLDYVSNLLGRMTRNGWVTRLRRGLYALSGPALGTATIHPFEVAVNLVEPSAISHWSALNHHGLTTQIPRIVTAITPKKVVTPSMRGASSESRRRKHMWTIEGVRYEFISVQEKHFFGIEQFWVHEFTTVSITDKERSVLDTFVFPRRFGGLGEGLGIIDEHLNTLDLNKLVGYALRYGKIAVVKRLGWALEDAGAASTVLNPLHSVEATGYHALDPTLPSRGPCDKKWMIQNNLVGRARE